MRHIGAATAAVLTTVLAGGMLVATDGAASADSAHTLGLSSFSDMVVDQVHGHVFVSGGAVKVAGLDGAVTGTISGITSARGMALTADGSQLVVANGDGLTVVDATTATVLRTISTGAGTCPGSVTPASGLIFFTSGDCSGGTPGLGAVDLSTDTVTSGLAPAGVSAASAQITSVATKPDMVVGFFDGDLAVLDTTGGATPAATVHASTSTLANSNPQDLALTPDGTQVVTASGGVYRHQVFATSDLSQVGEYATTSYPNAVAIRSDGQVATGIAGYYDPDIWIFPAGATSPTQKVDYGVVGNPGDSRELQTRGLAYGATNVYAVTGDVYGDVLTLRSVSLGPTPSMSVTTSASSLAYGKSVTVTARLLSPTHDRHVSIYATGVGASRHLLKTGTVDSSGRLSVTTALTRTTSLSAVFAGDDAYASRTVARSVSVHGRTVLTTASTKRSGSYHLFRGGTHPTISARVYSPNPGRCIAFVGQRYYSGAWRTFDSVSCLKLDSSSRQAVQLVGSFPAGTKVRVGGTFKGGTVNTSSPQAWTYVAFTR